MFSETISKLTAIQNTADAYIQDYDAGLREYFQLAEDVLLNRLVSAAVEAMDSIPEYNNGTEGSDALRDRLIVNLLSTDHVQLDQSGNPIVLFNERVAGSYSDLIAGMRAAYTSNRSPDVRAFFWKYGIYKPSVEGYTLDILQGRTVEYNQVVAERLAEWGSKVPYWYLIEYGNAGGGLSYPSFPGTNFVATWRAEARAGLKDLQRALFSTLREEAVKSLGEAVLTSQQQRPRPHSVMWVSVTSSAGNIIWRPQVVGSRQFLPGGQRTRPVL